MHYSIKLPVVFALALMPFVALPETAPKVSRFSVEHMDRSVDPGVDFYNFACGAWMKKTTIPSDKTGWGVFHILDEQNQDLVHGILDATAADAAAPAKSPTRLVGDFYRSAMDTNRVEQLGITPVLADLDRISALKSKGEIPRLLAELRLQGVGAGLFSAGVEPDEKNTSVYTFSFSQGGLSLPDRDYYLSSKFAKERAAYSAHIIKMLKLAGETESQAKKHARTILKIEKALAKASKSSTDLRDPQANYHKVATKELVARHSTLGLGDYLGGLGVSLSEVVVRQPEFLASLDKLVKARPLDEWKTYLRWHVLSGAASMLSSPFESESFAFYGTVLSGQVTQEPRWKRSADMVDGSLGEALGQIYVEKYFPPAARGRMQELIADVKTVFRGRLETVPWMSPETRAKALVKFERFSQKIGSPDKFRDYSSVEVRPDDYFGNVRRASAFEVHRHLARAGGPVVRTEWEMTPPTVNAYFNPSLNEIVFPAGILQPPFFDATADDAVNYGAIGFVIGHEITHGYDDQGRQYDADGNLKDWWTGEDAKEFNARAKKLSDQYSAYEPLPGLKVNGQLTMGENIADLGGVSIAYEALQRALAKDPSKRKLIDGFTPEQRFFLAAAQLWRTKTRDEAMRRQVTTNTHSPGRYRATGPLVNMQEFFDAFGIKEGAPMWRPPSERTKIW